MSTSELDNAAWLRQFFAKARNQRVPVSGTLELTSRCNLKCVHCYLGNQEDQHKKRAEELDTAEVKRLINEMVEAGCLSLLITGGDPMMRKDFPEIYEHAKRCGLVVTVFCDGVLVSDDIVDLFKRLPPRLVEISLYGASEEVYESVTRIKGSHQKCMQGIERLLGAGIHVGLKTVMMEPNRHEVSAMRQMAYDWGVSFRMDSAIFPCLTDRSKEPLDLRVDPKEAVAEELSDPKTRAGWMDYHQRVQNSTPIDGVYGCGAGLTGFYVSPFGHASPCIMTAVHGTDVRHRDFGDAWRKDLGKLRDLKARPDFGCNSCEKRSLCTSCGGFNLTENGDEQEKSEYVCATTQARWDLLLGEEAPKAPPRNPRLPIISES